MATLGKPEALNTHGLSGASTEWGNDHSSRSPIGSPNNPFPHSLLRTRQWFQVRVPFGDV